MNTKPQDCFVYLSKNDKKFFVKSLKFCFDNISEKSYLVDNLEMVYMGRGNSAFHKFKIDDCYEQNCLTIVFSDKSLFLRLNDEVLCKKWFKSVKYLIMMMKSKNKIKKGNELFNKTKRLENSYLTEDIVYAIWKTEIMPNWIKYREIIIPNLSISNMQNKPKKLLFNFMSNELFIKEESKQYFESGKYDFEYIWCLGLPEILRKKLWKIVIGNKLQINGILYNNFQVIELDFKSIVLKANDEFYFEEDIYLEIDRLELDENLYNSYILILGDCLTLLKKFQSIIALFSIDNTVFLKDIFTGLIKFTQYRSDISYSNSIALVYCIIYFNSSSHFDSFSNFVNFICSDKGNFLIQFWDKNEHFIKVKMDYFEYWLYSLCPEVFSHFQRMDISTRLYFFYWIENLFCETFEDEQLFRVWDMYLIKGEVVLYEIALSIIKLQERELLHLLINDLIDRLNKPPKEICNEILDIVNNGEINLSDSFYLLQKEEKIAYEKGILLQAYFIDD
jgi:hypothetical protein